MLLLAAGCSLQDFDYLQKGTGGSNAGGTNSSSAGTSSAGTENGEGGEGAEPNAGTGGQDPMTGGTKSGGSNSGGSNSGGSNSGGTNSGGGGGKGGMGPTGELINGSFETNTTAGWTVDPPSALMNPPRYAFVQPPTSGATVPDGGYEFSTWHMVDAFTVDLFQTIKGIEDGTYVFKGYLNLGGLHNLVELYARDCGGEDPEPTPILPAGDGVWSPVFVEGIEVKGGSCTVGLHIDSQAKGWLNADLFTFELDPNANPVGEGGAAGAGGASQQ